MMPAEPQPDSAVPGSAAESDGEWRNWSGSVRFRPDAIEHPEGEDAVVRLVRRARDRRAPLRAIGSGHSASDILPTNGTLVSLDRLRGIISADRAACTAVVRAGTPLHALGDELQQVDLALPNLGDIASQHLAGAVATGTHGTGPAFTSLSGFVVGGRVVAGTGDVVEFSAEGDSELTHALALSLGTLGIITELRLRVVPARRLQRREYCSTYDECRGHFERLADENLHFDFYWYPRSDEVKLRLLNAPTAGSHDLPRGRPTQDRAGWSHKVIPEHTGIALRFEECEYHVDRRVGFECFETVRQLIRRNWRSVAGWRVLYRWIARDDCYLSPAYRRDSVSISIHQNAQLPFEPFFTAIESVFREFDGRPHWAKKHTLRGASLRALYPAFERFDRVRRRLDPDGLFLNDYFRSLFAQEPPA